MGGRCAVACAGCLCAGAMEQPPWTIHGALRVGSSEGPAGRISSLLGSKKGPLGAQRLPLAMYQYKDDSVQISLTTAPAKGDTAWRRSSCGANRHPWQPHDTRQRLSCCMYAVMIALLYPSGH